MYQDFRIIDRFRVKHQAAEELSTLPTAGLGKNELQDEITVMVISQTKNHDQKRSIVLS